MALSRSEQMARIKGVHTAPERVLRSALWRAGLRYRLYARAPIGRPDVVFPNQRVAVFIDGCFWHGCPQHYVRPRSREEFWAAKLASNVDRDRQQTMQLEALGWRVIRVWEHTVFEQCAEVVERVRDALRGGATSDSTEWRVRRVEVLDASSDLERRHLVTLRAPLRTRVVDGRRTTTKWQRPRSGGHRHKGPN